MRRSIVLLVAGLALAACDKPAARVYSALPAAAERAEHNEPVFYNGKHYSVRFKFNDASRTYDVTISGKGRSLGSGAGDRQVVEQIAISAVRHFACPTGQKGHVVPGTPRHTGTAWSLQARCA
jgi:hypothetical protein